MAKSSGLENAPSTTGNKSGTGRSNNPPKVPSKPSTTPSKGTKK